MAAARAHTSTGGSLLLPFFITHLSPKAGKWLHVLENVTSLALSAASSHLLTGYHLGPRASPIGLTAQTMFNPLPSDSPRTPSTPNSDQSTWGTHDRPDSTQVPWIPNHHPYSQGLPPSAAGPYPNSPNCNYSTTSFSSASHYYQKPGRPSFSRGGAASSSAVDLAQYIEQQNLLTSSQKDGKANKPTSTRNWRVIVFAVLASLALATLAVMVPVYFKFFKPDRAASFKGPSGDLEGHAGGGSRADIVDDANGRTVSE
jgi:hypothetical protein